MHSSVGMPDPANWLISQRLASWSYSTTGSPLPLVSHTPPKPDQSEEIATGPMTELPVALSKTCRPSLTICTYCVSPTSPLVSGGAQLQPTPGNVMPSKLMMGAGICCTGAIVFCTTGSTLSTWWLGSCGFFAASRSSSALRSSSPSCHAGR